MKEQALGKMLLDQSNLVLDVLEGKAKVEDATCFLGCKYVCINLLKARLEKNVVKEDKKPDAKTKTGKVKK